MDWAYLLYGILILLSFFYGKHLGNLNQLHATTPCVHTSNSAILSSVQPILVNSSHQRKCLPSYKSVECSTSYWHSNLRKQELKKKNLVQNSFPLLHHPSGPVQAHIFLMNNASNSVDNCQNIYVTRTGAKASMPNKCIGIVYVAPNRESKYGTIYRKGASGGLIDQFQGDFSLKMGYNDEELYLQSFLFNRESMIEEIRNRFKKSSDKNNQSKYSNVAIVLLANSGVSDLLTNLLCSFRSSNLNEFLNNIIVFVTEESLRDQLETKNIATFFCGKRCGNIPNTAAKRYGDLTFARMMWMKTVSVYLTLSAGYDVLFQDVDIVWMKNALLHIDDVLNHPKIPDLIFMDDGARSPRFAPYFANSGFYYVRHSSKTLYFMERMLKSMSELSSTHSHQATMMRYLLEVHELSNMEVALLDQFLFPSGSLFHHNKTYMKQLSGHEIEPFVFHMCWTESRVDKVRFLKELGFWGVKSNNFEKPWEAICEKGPYWK